MSNPRDDGGPAFPVARGTAVTGDEYPDAHYPGMSLRDYFAGQAMSVFASHLGQEDWDDGVVKKTSADEFAEAAYVMADAMLEARKG